MNIRDMEMGKVGVVQSVNAEGSIRQRLFDMGVLPNSKVFKERAALTGDPIWIKVNDVQIALRQNEAEAISVEML